MVNDFIEELLNLDMRLTFRPKMQPGEEWVAYKVRTARMLRLKWKNMGLSSLAELCAEKVWKTMA